MQERIRSASTVGVLAVAMSGCAFDGSPIGAPPSGHVPISATTTSGPPLDPATVTTEGGDSSGPSMGSTGTSAPEATTTGSRGSDPIDDASSESTGSPPPMYAEACPDDPSLVACWDFDFDGIDANGMLGDGTPNALDITTSGVAWAEGPFGDATEFGSDSRVYVGATPALDLADAVTLDAWIYIHGEAADGDQRRGIFDHQGQYAMFYYPGQGIRCSGLNEVFGPITPSEADRWMHVACTFGDGRLRAFVDGAVAGDVAFEGPLVVGGTELVALGNNAPRFDAPFLGAMARLRVWSRAMTPGDIAALATR